MSEENKKIPCTCPKGGMYESVNGSTFVCDKCMGSEWVDKPAPKEEKGVLCQVCGACKTNCGNPDINCICRQPKEDVVEGWEERLLTGMAKEKTYDEMAEFTVNFISQEIKKAKEDLLEELRNN